MPDQKEEKKELKKRTEIHIFNKTVTLGDLVSALLIVVTVIYCIIGGGAALLVDFFNYFGIKSQVAFFHKIESGYDIKVTIFLGILAATAAYMNARRSKTEIAKKCKEGGTMILYVFAGVCVFFFIIIVLGIVLRDVFGIINFY